MLEFVWEFYVKQITYSRLTVIDSLVELEELHVISFYFSNIKVMWCRIRKNWRCEGSWKVNNTELFV